MLAEVLELRVAEVDAVERLACRSRDEQLAAMAGPADPRGAVDVEPVVRVVGEDGPARVHAHADLHGCPLGPVARGERALCCERGGERGTRIGEGDEELVGAAVDLVAVRLRDRLADQPPVLREDLRVLVAELLDEGRRALDVREEESDVAGRGAAHACQSTAADWHRRPPS